MKKATKLFKKIFGYCPVCRVRTGKLINGLFKYPYTERQNTRYEDDSRNFFWGCGECHKENDAYWEDMWQNVPRY